MGFQFLNQGLNPHPLHLKVDSLPLDHQGSPNTIFLKWGDDRGWDVWISSLTQRTRVWTNSGRRWRTGKPGVLQSMGWQRVRHNWATELNWNSLSISSLHLEEDASRVIQCHLLSLGAGLTSTQPRCWGDGLVRIPQRPRCGLRPQFTQVAVTPSGPDLFQLLLQSVWGQMSVGRLSYGSFLLSKLIPSSVLGARMVRPRTPTPVDWLPQTCSLPSSGLERTEYETHLACDLNLHVHNLLPDLLLSSEDRQGLRLWLVHSIIPPGFLGSSAGKESTCNAGDLGLIPELGRSPGEEKGYPPQYSGLENSMDCGKESDTTEWLSLSLKSLCHDSDLVSEPSYFFGNFENDTKYSSTKVILSLLTWKVHFKNLVVVTKTVASSNMCELHGYTSGWQVNNFAVHFLPGI